MKRPKRGEPEALAPLPVPERDEATLMARQGTTSGKVGKGSAWRRRKKSSKLARSCRPQQPRGVLLSEEEERMKRVEEVMSFTGVERSAAEKALEENASVWLRKPRLQHARENAGTVTFGGRVCSPILASQGWNPATAMVDVIAEVRQALVEAQIVAYSTVAIKKEYPKPAIQLERLSSELFRTANDFCKEGMTVLSAAAAAPFLGDLSRLEATDKIGLPFSYANEIYERAEQGLELHLPLTFEVTSRLGRKTHCAIFEFINGLPDMHVLLPKWVLEDMGVEERDLVRVRGVMLDLITGVRIQPHSVDFYHAAEHSQRFFHVQVTKLFPRAAVRIIDSDVQHHFEFKVDFEPAPDLEDEAAKKEFQDRAVAALKLRREKSKQKEQDLEQRRAAARQRRYEQLLSSARSNATGPALDVPSGGNVDIALRMPDGTQVKGQFPEGGSIAQLMVLALETDWAKKAHPWGIYLRMAYPKKVLKEGDLITRDFHRSTLSVQEEQPPDEDERLAEEEREPLARGSAEPEALSSVLPELNEEEVMARTQRAFEIQRFLRAGFSLQEAEAKYAAGEVLLPSEESRRPEPAPPAGAAPAREPRLERTLSEEEQRQGKVEMVVNFTGVDRDVASVALEDHDWVRRGERGITVEFLMESHACRPFRAYARGLLLGDLSVATIEEGSNRLAQSKALMALEYVLQHSNHGQVKKVLEALEEFAEVVTGRTGHAEAVQVIFDPVKLDLVDLLRWFWEAHDPTQQMGQGNDSGTQYRSLYFFDQDQKELFLASRDAYQEALAAAGIHREIATEIRSAADFPQVFYYAEDVRVTPYLTRVHPLHLQVLPLGIPLAKLQVEVGLPSRRQSSRLEMPAQLKRKGSQFGDKKLVVITGTSSGLGKATTKALLNAKEYHVIGAVRDLEKMAVVAELEGFDPERFTAMQVDLASFESVKNFTKAVDKFRGDRPIDRLVCNAAVYQPTLDYPKWTVDGHEQQLQINYLSHFLLTSGIMPMMTDSEDARVVMIGSVTGNDNTVGGGGPIAMMDGYNFNGAKMYKDTKLALMMTSNMLHERFHRSTGISFSSIYPGCIAETPLFREKRPWFRKYFPIFMKYITGGYVGEEEAGTRLFQVIHDPKCVKSGVYWSWNGGPREGRGLEAMEKGGQIVGAGGAGGGWESIYENDQSDKAYQAKSPCPTLKVVGAATSLLGIMEEKARMKASRNGEGAKIVADKTLPKEERRGHVPDSVFKGSKAGEAVADEALEADEADVDGFTFEVPELDEPENKEPPKMIKGHELLGDTPVVFQPQNVMTMARAGQALSEVASQADVFIRYKCKKGKCKTCAVNIDGKWVSACQTKIPRQTESGKNFEVRVRQVSDAHKMAEKAAFFTPKSFADGVVNNGLGTLGVRREAEAFGADPDFQVRMEREKKVEELLAQRRQSLKVKQSTLRGGNAIGSEVLRRLGLGLGGCGPLLATSGALSRCLGAWIAGRYPCSGWEGAEASSATGASARPWRWEPPMRFPRAFAAAIGGGTELSGFRPRGFVPLSVVECFHGEQQVWETLPPMPTARRSLAALLAGGFLYAIGGSNGHKPLAVAERMHLVSRHWEVHLGSIGTSLNLSLVLAEGKIVAVGTPGEVELFDPQLGHWSQLKQPISDPFDPWSRGCIGRSAFSTGRWPRHTRCSAMATDPFGKLYVCGGYRFDFRASRHVEVVDLKENFSVPGPILPSASAGGVLALWFKIAAGAKGLVVERALRRAPEGACLEIGTYVGPLLVWPDLCPAKVSSSSVMDGLVVGRRGMEHQLKAARTNRRILLLAFVVLGSSVTFSHLPASRARRRFWLAIPLLSAPAWAEERMRSFKKVDSVINSYTENAGVAGQNNQQVAAYADLGEGLKAATIYKPKADTNEAARTVQNGDVVTVDLIGYLTGWNGNIFVRTQDTTHLHPFPA
eukprot:g30894.t1